MWTDINTKPKQGAVFCKFRGHMMGIPVDYNNADYINKVPLMPKVSMLPLTKEQLASQECVGEQESHNNPTEDRLDGSVQDTSLRPPIIMISGSAWSPSVYRALRLLLGNTLDVAWKRVFTWRNRRLPSPTRINLEEP
jgi:hypothetical protein